MNSNFILLTKTERIIDYINKILPNFPKKEVVLRQNIEKTMYSMIENIFYFNANKTSRIRDKYIKDFIVMLSMLDYYSRTSHKKLYISNRQFEVIGRALLEIRKISFSLISDKDEKSKDTV